MHLWSYQHPSILDTLRQGERHLCPWERVSGERWQLAFRWMCQQMAERGIDTGEHAPIWVWHSVNRIGGKPDDNCARALMSDIQLEQGVALLELEVPDHLALTSCYGVWNRILDGFIDGAEPEAGDVVDCFTVQLSPRRGRPPLFFQEIQACIPFIEPAWLVGWEMVDRQKIWSK